MQRAAQAFAKINLVHEVGPLRPDGLHEVKSLMQSVGLADELAFEKSADTEVSVEWHPSMKSEQLSSPNLVEKAIRILADKWPQAAGTRVSLLKKIPVGAGLGGGSADAATTLREAAVLHGIELSDNEILEMARPLGADVAFCLRSGTALAAGAGEELTYVESDSIFWWVIGVPGFSLPTPAVYKQFEDLPPTPPVDPIEATVEAVAAGRVASVAAGLHNDLEGAAFMLKPQLASLKQAMIQAGPLGTVMTGSGSAIIGLCASESHAHETARSLGKTFAMTKVVSSETAGGRNLSTRRPAEG